MRVKAVISYDGSRFFGSQKQKDTPQTVFGTIERVLRALKITSNIHGSGRTDSGVHASFQVLHIDLPPYWQDIKKLQTVLNYHLFDEGIYFKRIVKTTDDFHARFHAKKRSYLYIFKSDPTVFEQKYVAKYERVDTIKLQNALKIFEGSHDFQYFCKTGSEVKDYKRTIFHTKVIRYKGYTLCSISGNGFLRRQVRMIIAAALEVAYGNATIQDIKNQLNLESKTFTKPAHREGLYLSKVLY